MFLRNICWLPNNYIQLYPTPDVTVPLSLVTHDAVKKYSYVEKRFAPPTLSTTRSGGFTPAETYPDIHWTVGWVGPTPGSERREERRSLPALPDSSVVLPVQQSLYTLSCPASSSFSPYGLLEYRAPCFMIMLYCYTPAPTKYFARILDFWLQREILSCWWIIMRPR
jgi:hypothetical protein